jgi:antitoxin (DNA-binding transcriptional repressor) of toxin-antitoxin stability system
MKFVSIRELRANAAALRETLEEAKEIVLTVSGKPFAILTPVGPGELEEELTAVRRARARVALDRIRRAARKRGLEDLHPGQIDELVSRTRKGRRSRRGG